MTPENRVSETTAPAAPARAETAVGREATRGGAAVFSPRVDIYETTDELVLIADLPGVEADRLELKFEDGLLSLHARVGDRAPAGAKRLLAEYGIGDFWRSFQVNEQVDAAKISADLRDGVLTVRLPKVEAVRPRKITVRAGG